MTPIQITILLIMATFYAVYFTKQAMQRKEGFVAAAGYAFHQQILNEEEYLTQTFGEEYIQYKNQVNRYI